MNTEDRLSQGALRFVAVMQSPYGMALCGLALLAGGIAVLASGTLPVVVGDLAGDFA